MVATAVALFLLVFLGVVVHEVVSLLRARRKMQRADEYAHSVPFIIPGPPEDVARPERPAFVGRRIAHDVAVPLQVSSEPVDAAPSWVRPTTADSFEVGATMVFARSSSHPLHLLPAYLEVISGVPLGEDIQLMGDIGEVNHITIGRDVEEAHGVELSSPTVSRRHASLTFADGQWTIANLSHTNPLILNDHQLGSQSSGVPLSDGDRIELGEVVLQFHAR